MFGSGPTLPPCMELPSLWVLTQGPNAGVYKGVRFGEAIGWELQDSNLADVIQPSFDVAAFLAAHTVAYWKMDGTPSDDDEFDSTGRGNELVSNEGVSNFLAGKLGLARVFDGASSIIRASTPDLQIDGGLPFILGAWIKVADLSGGRPLIAKGDEFRWSILDNGAVRFFFSNLAGDDGDTLEAGVGSVVVDTWRFLFTYYDGETLSLYANNVPLVRFNVGPQFCAGAADFTIGASPGLFFNGLIDDTMIIKPPRPSVVVSGAGHVGTVVTGAGTPEANGVYTRRGISNGRPYYNLEGQPSSVDNYAIWWDTATWVMFDDANNVYYTSSGDVSFPWLATWIVEAGDAPVPTVAADPTSAPNGTYTYRGQHLGKPYYNLVGQPDNSAVNVIRNNTGMWQLLNFDTDTLYLASPTAAFPWLANDWEVGDGTAPVPTVAIDPDYAPLTDDQFDAICEYLWNNGDGRALY